MRSFQFLNLLNPLRAVPDRMKRGEIMYEQGRVSPSGSVHVVEYSQVNARKQFAILTFVTVTMFTLILSMLSNNKHLNTYM